MNSAPRVLVANPDEYEGRRAAAGLSALGFAIDRASSARGCLDLLAAGPYEAVLSVPDLGDCEAEQLLQQLRRQCPSLAFVVLSERGSQESIDLGKAGLDHYLPGELPPDQLATRLREIIASRKSPPTKERSNGSHPSALGAQDSAESTLV